MKGILFKPDMIKAIVEGRKTVTRRVMQNQPYGMDKVYFNKFKKDFGGRKPRYQVGSTVYIKEAWQSLGNKENTVYKLDGESKLVWDINGKHGEEVVKKWSSPLFMPVWAARYFIKITDVRAERLQEITLPDIYDEGIDVVPSYDRIDVFKRLWDSINKDYQWESNPWVFRYEFEIKNDN